MDARLVSVVTGLWLGAWSVTAWGLRWNLTWLLVWVTAWILIALAGWKVISRKQLSVSRISIVFFTCFVLGVVLGAVRVWPVLDNPVRAAASHKSIVTVTATVDGDASVKPDYARTRVRLTHVMLHGVSYQLRVPASVTATTESSKRILGELVPGATIHVVGKLYPELPGRVSAAGIRAVADPVVVRGAPRYQAWASGLRGGLHAAVDGYWPDAAALIPGLTLGDTSRVTDELNSDMKASGLSHLVAVSGTNVTLLLGLVLAVLRRRGASRATTIAASLAVLAIFVVVVRPQPSVLRATAMGIVGLVAMYLGGKRTALPALLLAALALLVIDPWLATSYGFALSVAATAGLVLWASRVMDFLLNTTPRRYPLWLLEALAMTLSAQLAVLPMMVAMGSTMSLASIPANVIAAPLAGLVLVSGLVVSLLALLLPNVAHVIASIPALGAQVIALTAHTGASITALTIPWPVGPGGIACAAIVVACVLRWSVQWRSYQKAQRNSVAAVCATLALLLWVHPIHSLDARAPDGWLMMSCDVGQGDATILKVAPHEAIVIDVGGDADLIDKCLNRVEIDRIPLLVLTHFHADHVGGLEGALRDRYVGQVRVTELQDPPLTTQFALDTLRAHDLSWSVWKFPEVMRVGNLTLSCLWPARSITGQGSDANNASIGLLVTGGGITALLPGDMEPPAQEAAISGIAPVAIDVEKVPHHGSRYQSQDFAIWASPTIAIISVGKGNDYGHPAASTIELYQAVGARVLRTDQLGSIFVVRDPSGIHVVTQ